MNTQYSLLNESLKATTSGGINILILSGDYGIGKSYRVLDYVKQNKIDYEYIHSYTTPLSFYDLLYRNRDKKIIIFDDIDNLEDSKIVAMIKSSCWAIGTEKREVAYFSTSEKINDLGLPERFCIDSNIILIFNKIPKEFEPIINRGIHIEFRFSFEERMDIFKELQESANIDGTILDYVTLNCTPATKNLTLRSLVILSNLKRLGFNWQDFAREMFKVDEEDALLIEKVSLCPKIEDACQEWCDETGLSRRTFFRRKKKLKR